jgi:hypothetical protein
MLNSKLKTKNPKLSLISTALFLCAISTIWLNSNSAGHFKVLLDRINRITRIKRPSAERASRRRRKENPINPVNPV